MINKLEIVFANGSVIQYDNVTWFTFKRNKLTFGHGENEQIEVFKIEEVMSIYVLSVGEDEPSMNLPFEQS